MLGDDAQIQLNQQFALDVNGVKKLQLSSKNNPNEALRTGSKEFEAIFLHMMIKSMREASFKSELLQSHQNDFYTGLFDQQISKSMAERGIGLADLMIKQLTTNQTTELGRRQVVDEEFSSLSNQIQAKYFSDVSNASINQKQISDKHQTASSKKQSSPSDNVKDFIDELLEHAISFGKQTGMHAGYSIAHAALESGWGKKIPKYSDGKSSFNLFGIKANKDWAGKVVEITTTEYNQGIASKVNERFKAYDSYAEAFADYAKMLTQNQRYAKVLLNSKSPWEYAKNLQLTGYATDPNYAEKLFSVMKRLGYS